MSNDQNNIGNKRVSRRMFLKGLSGAMLPIPTLVSLLPKKAWAAGAQPYRAYVTVTSTNDYGIHASWFGPKATQLGWTPEALMTPAGEHTMGYSSLRSLLDANGMLSPIFRNHLNSFIDKATLIRGLDYGVGCGHSVGGPLGNVDDFGGAVRYGTRHIPTIDQIINKHAGFNPKGADILVALAGAGISGSYQYNGTRQGITAGTTRSLYEYVFKNGAVPEANAGTVVQPHPSRDLLSDVLGDYNRIKNGGQISKSDLAVLTNIMDQLSTVQRGLASSTVPSGLSCNYKSLEPQTSYVETWYYWEQESAAQNYKVMADILLAGMMCDLFRSVHIPWNNFDQDVYRRVAANNFSDGITDTAALEGNRHDFHGAADHCPFFTTTRDGVRVKNHVFMAEWHEYIVKHLVKPLAEGMDRIVDPANGKSMLYNSLIHMTESSSLGHGHMSNPCLLIGTAGGKINSGHLIDCGNKFSGTPRIFGGDGDLVFSSATYSRDPNSEQFHGNYHGILYNRLFKTIYDAFDVPSSAYAPYLVRTADVTAAEAPGGYGMVGKVLDGGRPIHDLSKTNTPVPMPPVSRA